jgi:hypothetical protein
MAPRPAPPESTNVTGPGVALLLMPHWCRPARSSYLEDMGKNDCAPLAHQSNTATEGQR